MNHGIENGDIKPRINMELMVKAPLAFISAADFVQAMTKMNMKKNFTLIQFVSMFFDQLPEKKREGALKLLMRSDERSFFPNLYAVLGSLGYTFVDVDKAVLERANNSLEDQVKVLEGVVEGARAMNDELHAEVVDLGKKEKQIVVRDEVIADLMVKRMMTLIENVELKRHCVDQARVSKMLELVLELRNSGAISESILLQDKLSNCRESRNDVLVYNRASVDALFLGLCADEKFKRLPIGFETGDLYTGTESFDDPDKLTLTFAVMRNLSVGFERELADMNFKLYGDADLQDKDFIAAAMLIGMPEMAKAMDVQLSGESRLAIAELLKAMNIDFDLDKVVSQGGPKTDREAELGSGVISAEMHRVCQKILSTKVIKSNILAYQTLVQTDIIAYDEEERMAMMAMIASTYSADLTKYLSAKEGSDQKYDVPVPHLVLMSFDPEIEVLFSDLFNAMLEHKGKTLESPKEKAKDKVFVIFEKLIGKFADI